MKKSFLTVEVLYHVLMMHNEAMSQRTCYFCSSVSIHARPCWVKWDINRRVW